MTQELIDLDLRSSILQGKIITYYLLPITYYLLPITYYLLPITYYLLPRFYSEP
jgi:hypothetical protein